MKETNEALLKARLHAIQIKNVKLKKACLELGSKIAKFSKDVEALNDSI